MNECFPLQNVYRNSMRGNVKRSSSRDSVREREKEDSDDDGDERVHESNERGLKLGFWDFFPSPSLLSAGSVLRLLMRFLSLIERERKKG